MCQQSEENTDGEPLELVYYRPVKTGHITMIREVKVRFKGKRGLFLKFMDQEITWTNAKKWANKQLVPWENADE